MSADARVWCEGASDKWTGWANGTTERPQGDLKTVITKLEIAADTKFWWLPTDHDNGRALSRWTYPRDAS